MSGALYRVEAARGDDAQAARMAEEIRAGLTARPRWLPSKHFYDERGSRLEALAGQHVFEDGGAPIRRQLEPAAGRVVDDGGRGVRHGDLRGCPLSLTWVARPGGTTMRRSRGFVNYDIWLVLTAVALATALIVPNVMKAVHKRRLRRSEIAVIQRVAFLEHAQFARTHAYLDSLPPVLTPETRLLGLRRDSAGWSVAITADSTQRWPVTCGVFEGPAKLAPDSAVTTPGRIGCW